jgi:hypothetical protein
LDVWDTNLNKEGNLLKLGAFFASGNPIQAYYKVKITIIDLLPRLKRMWKEFGFGKQSGKEPIIMRMHSLGVDAKDFPPQLAEIWPPIERIQDKSTGGILMRLLCDFSDEADQHELEGLKHRRANMSIVDKALELYKADRKAP